MRFVEIKTKNDAFETINIEYIIKLYTCVYDNTSYTRIIMANGGGMIDTPYSVDTVLTLIQNAPNI